jgi:hypothetical protein
VPFGVVGGGHRPIVMPTPLGTSVRAWETVMRANAEADDFVIYLSEWSHGAQLGPYGTYHLEQIVHRLPRVPFPVLIQSGEHPPLDQLRRLTIVTLLHSHGMVDAEARVVIGRPRAEGLYGDEGPRVFLRLLTGGSGGQGGGGQGGGGQGGIGIGGSGGGGLGVGGGMGGLGGR